MNLLLVNPAYAVGVIQTSRGCPFGCEFYGTRLSPGERPLNSPQRPRGRSQFRR